ncbi:glycosyltransferase [Georgenia halophila]|uniref:Glycosyltransferase n=1 Tax=Georgenia halophila TaxID=620889 RepID=A0ABP8L2J0_9MICO
MLAFGTYDVKAHPRVQVLIDGLCDHGITVEKLNAPLGLSTAQRVDVLQRPWLVPWLVARLLRRWATLTSRSARIRRGERSTHVLVGYLGHFDVLLARVLFPRAQIILDHLIFAAGTAKDRGVRSGVRIRLLTALDRAALRAADLVVVDTVEHQRLVPVHRRADSVVVPVGATDRWFAAGDRAAQRRGRTEETLSVVFFGLFTPLQGTTVVGEAVRRLHEQGNKIRLTLVGSGQDSHAVHALVDGVAGVTWHDWVDGGELPEVVASHDVCLGIFGVTDKALAVVPNKVYQGAAAGCAVVTSDTEPQRRALGDAAVLVEPGSPEALAAALSTLAENRDRLDHVRRACLQLAGERFTARAVTVPMVEALR